MPSYSTGFCVAATRKGRGSGVADAVDRDLPLLHRLEQRRLGLGRRAVDLVGEQQVGEDRTLAEATARRGGLSITIEPVMSPGIRSGVNCTRRVCTDSAAARLRTSRVLATPGHALHQHVPAAQQRDQQAGHRGVLADDGLGHLGANGAQRARGRPGWSVVVVIGVTPLCRARRAVGPGRPGRGRRGVGAACGPSRASISSTGRPLLAATSATSRSGRTRRGRCSRSARRARAAARSVSAAWVRSPARR